MKCKITYENHKGEARDHVIYPIFSYMGSTKFHPTTQLLLRAKERLDGKGPMQTIDFAVADIIAVEDEKIDPLIHRDDQIVRMVWWAAFGEKEGKEEGDEAPRGETTSEKHGCPLCEDGKPDGFDEAYTFNRMLAQEIADLGWWDSLTKEQKSKVFKWCKDNPTTFSEWRWTGLHYAMSRMPRAELYGEEEGGEAPKEETTSEEKQEEEGLTDAEKDFLDVVGKGFERLATGLERIASIAAEIEASLKEGSVGSEELSSFLGNAIEIQRKAVEIQEGKQQSSIEASAQSSTHVDSKYPAFYGIPFESVKATREVRGNDGKLNLFFLQFFGHSMMTAFEGEDAIKALNWVEGCQEKKELDKEIKDLAREIDDRLRATAKRESRPPIFFQKDRTRFLSSEGEHAESLAGKPPSLAAQMEAKAELWATAHGCPKDAYWERHPEEKATYIEALNRQFLAYSPQEKGEEDD